MEFFSTRLNINSFVENNERSIEERLERLWQRRNKKEYSDFFFSSLIWFLCPLFLEGFLISRDRMPKAWIWMHYLSPMKYGIEAILMSQFIGKKVRQWGFLPSPPPPQEYSIQLRWQRLRKEKKSDRRKRNRGTEKQPATNEAALQRKSKHTTGTPVFHSDPYPPSFFFALLRSKNLLHSRRISTEKHHRRVFASVSRWLFESEHV